MIYATSRSDLKPYIEAAQKARSRTFLDLTGRTMKLFRSGNARLMASSRDSLDSVIKGKAPHTGGLHA